MCFPLSLPFCWDELEKGNLQSPLWKMVRQTARGLGTWKLARFDAKCLVGWEI